MIVTPAVQPYRCGLPVAMPGIAVLTLGAAGIVVGAGWIGVLFVRAISTARRHGLIL